MKNKKVVMLMFIFIALIINIFPNVVNADIGEKPSITIKIKNLETNKYIIDLLTYAEKTGDYYSDSNFSNYGRTVHFDKIAKERNITIDQAKQLYNIDYNGWISANTRNSLLWGTCNGNNEHEHYFNYFGVPDRYKIIIINYDTGDIKVSDEIIRKDFSSKVMIDYNSMSISSKSTLNIKSIVLALLITIAIELIIALLMKFRKYIKVIIMTNTTTNILLQLSLNIISGNYLTKLIIFEILVIIAEYFIYKKYMNEESAKKILLYTLIANMVTACLTFIIK